MPNIVRERNVGFNHALSDINKNYLLTVLLLMDDLISLPIKREREKKILIMI